LEFTNKHLLDFFQKQNIIWYPTYGHAVIADRAFQTLMGKLMRFFTHSGKRRYINDIQTFTIVNNYNDSRHTTTKFASNEVNEENQSEVFQDMYPEKTEQKEPDQAL